MGRRFKITASQHARCIKEGINLAVDNTTHGDLNQRIEKTKRDAESSGLRMDDVNIVVPASETNESKVITHKEMVSERLRILKENSDLYDYKTFIYKIAKK